MNKRDYKRKYIAMGTTHKLTISGYKSLLPLYREEINKINEAENLRVFNQLAAREGVDNVDVFIDQMNKDAEYRTRILRKYKIE